MPLDDYPKLLCHQHALIKTQKSSFESPEQHVSLDLWDAHVAHEQQTALCF